MHLYVYLPAEWVREPSFPVEINSESVRSVFHLCGQLQQLKRKHLIAFNFSWCCQKKVGGMGSWDISRFGKASILIYAKSETQSHMLTLMKVSNDDDYKSY